MICPYCLCYMELVDDAEEQQHVILEEFPFEDYLVVEIKLYRCPECEHEEITYDA